MVAVGVRLSRATRSLDASGSTAPSIVSACKVSRTVYDEHDRFRSRIIDVPEKRINARRAGRHLYI